jgi:hypothetical protein
VSSARRQQHSRKHAKAARHKCAVGRTPPERWVHPLRRLRRVIASSQRLIDETRRVIGSQNLSGLRLVRCEREINGARRCLDLAAERLGRAVCVLRAVTDSMVAAPTCSDPARRTLTAVTSSWLEATRDLNWASDLLDGLPEFLVNCMQIGAITVVPEWQPAPVRRIRVIPPPRTDSVRWFLIVRLLSARDRISSVPVRRPRPVAIAIADAPRLISRGRAPPALSPLL